MPKVLVYVRSAEWQALAAQGHEPATWVRNRVAEALDARPGQLKPKMHEDMHRDTLVPHFKPDPKRK